ncbi:MAG: hypothetical protein GY943_30520 [Chloroflexi bacterium]|nr:hypothetical protein [Chloroflexota bacterium]
MSLNPTTTLISNGSSTSSAMQWHGGRATFAVDGTFGGATISLQKLGPDDSSYVDVGADGIFTEEGMGEYSLGPCLVRVEIVGGSPSGIYASITRNGH